MSATAIITTPAPDRVRDSVNPRGGLYENHKKNPVVLWEHGFQLSLPIAKSEDPDGNYTVVPGANRVLATSYFTDEFLEAEQVFALVAKRLIRATSIRFQILKSSIVRENAEETFVIDEWDLQEWSWCAIGCNPEALADVVGKNRLAGKPISGELMKSFKPLLPKRKAQGRGWKSEEGDMAKNTVYSVGDRVKVKAGKEHDSMTKDKNGTIKQIGTPALGIQFDGMPDVHRWYVDDEVTATDNDEDAGEGEGGAMKSGNNTTAKTAHPKAGEEPGVEDPETGEETEKQKYGAQVLSAFRSALGDTLEQVTSAKASLENETVASGVDAAMSLLEQATAVLDGCYAEAYGKSLSLAFKSGTPDETAQALQDFLATGTGPRFELAGITATLNTLAKSKNLSAVQKRDIVKATRKLGSLVVRSKADPAKTAEQPSAAVGELVGEMRKTMADLNQKLQDILPFKSAS